MLSRRGSCRRGGNDGEFDLLFTFKLVLDTSINYPTNQNQEFNKKVIIKPGIGGLVSCVRNDTDARFVECAKQI